MLELGFRSMPSDFANSLTVTSLIAKGCRYLTDDGRDTCVTRGYGDCVGRLKTSTGHLLNRWIGKVGVSELFFILPLTSSVMVFDKIVVVSI